MLAFILALSTAHAFGLDGHRVLTERTVDLAAKDDPTVAPFESVLVTASLVEDLDLVTKWGRYSHYYDPEHTLVGMRRLTSRDRIDVLADELDVAVARGDDGEAWWITGRLLHHVQDMASPPHVVPVPHNGSDGFESYDVSTLAPQTGARWVPPMSGPDAHQALALETRTLVEDGGWDQYWTGNPSRFGHYGAIGNTFGRSVEPRRTKAERRFIADRTEAAVAFGRAFILDTAARLAVREAPLLAEAPGSDHEPTRGTE